jgi:hypothetical protein
MYHQVTIGKTPFEKHCSALVVIDIAVSTAQIGEESLSLAVGVEMINLFVCAGQRCSAFYTDSKHAYTSFRSYSATSSCSSS